MSNALGSFTSMEIMAHYDLKHRSPKQARVFAFSLAVCSIWAPVGSCLLRRNNKKKPLLSCIFVRLCSVKTTIQQSPVRHLWHTRLATQVLQTPIDFLQTPAVSEWTLTRISCNRTEKNKRFSDWKRRWSEMVSGWKYWCSCTGKRT